MTDIQHDPPSTRTYINYYNIIITLFINIYIYIFIKTTLILTQSEKSF